MLKKSTLMTLVTAAALTAGAAAHAAVVVAQNFDSTPADNWNFAITGEGGAVSTIAGPAADNPNNSRILSGTASFQHRPTTSVATSSTITFDAVSLADFKDAQVSIRLAAISASANNGLDNGETVQVFIARDGAAFASTPDLTVQGNGNARWSYTSGTGIAEVTVGTPVPNFRPTAGQDRTTDGYSTLLLNIPNGASSISMKIVSLADNTGEIWAIDNIAVNATALPEPSVAALALPALGLLARRRRSL